jgi:hypothetical protein
VIKLASDENFDGDIVRGLLRRVPELDIVRVQDVGLAGSPDPGGFTASGPVFGFQRSEGFAGSDAE